MPVDLTLASPTLDVVPWDDPVVDALGHPPRSTYVERFWLSILGPTATWLVRHLDARLEDGGGTATLDLAATAEALGLGGGTGRNSPVVRSLARCHQFGIVRGARGGGLSGGIAVRRALPPLTRHQITRLPLALQAEHDAWRAMERDAATLDAQRRRARRVALALAELGEDVPTTEQRLHAWRIHPVVAREAAVWAHRLVVARSSDDGPPADPGSDGERPDGDPPDAAA
jgi:hypothetical protein